MMAHSVGLVAKLADPAWLFKNCWMVDTASKRTLTVCISTIQAEKLMYSYLDSRMKKGVVIVTFLRLVDVLAECFSPQL